MNKQKVIRIMRFLAGGGIGVSAYYITLYSLTEFTGMWYVASSIIGSILNYGINFILQKFWVFRNRNTRDISRQIVIYFLAQIGFFLTNILLLYLLVEHTHIHYLVAQLILTVLLTIASFVITKKIFTS